MLCRELLLYKASSALTRTTKCAPWGWIALVSVVGPDVNQCPGPDGGDHDCFHADSGAGATGKGRRSNTACGTGQGLLEIPVSALL